MTQASALFDALALAAIDSVAEFNPQNLANMAWAVATARLPAPRLLDAVAVASVVKLRRAPNSFTPQNLANLAWACAHRRPRT